MRPFPKQVVFGVALALAGILVGYVGILKGRPSPPVYQGRALDDWLMWVDSDWTISHPDRSSPEWLQASNAIVQIGLEGVPWYLDWMEYSPSPAAEALRPLLRRVPSDWQPRSWGRPVGWLRSYASYEALRILGPRLVPHVAELNVLATSGSGDSPKLAAKVLIAIGPQAWPQVLNLVTNGTYPGSRSALLSIGELGTAARPAIPTLIQQLQGGGLIWPKEAAFRLGALKLEPDQSVPALLRALNSSTPELRRAAAFALGEFGADASPALPALERLQTNRDRYLAKEASNAVRAIRAARNPGENSTSSK